MGVILLCLCAAGYMIWQVMDIYPEGYTAEQLGIEELYSMRDENGNGTDDYHDFVAGARAYVESGPLYQSIYYAGGGPVTAGELCRLTCEDKAAISRALGMLKGRGFINYDAGKYNAEVTLTGKGRELCDFIKVKSSAAVEAAGADLSEEERALLYKSLASVADNLEKYYNALSAK